MPVNAECMFQRKQASVAVGLSIAIALQSVHAQEPKPPDWWGPSCAVSDENVVAATLRQKVSLETPGCTASLGHMVDSTLSDIRKIYAEYYRQAHLNPPEIDAVSLLLVRRRLLTTEWSASGRAADTVEHYQASKDPALLAEIQARLQDYLTAQQMALLGTYEQTLPARYLLEPVTSRLQQQGRALSEAQWAEVLPATQQLVDELRKDSPPEISSTEANSLPNCRQAHARADQLAEQVRQLLTAVLDDEQVKTAEAYYQDLFARRAHSVRRFEASFASDDAALCTYPPY